MSIDDDLNGPGNPPVFFARHQTLSSFFVFVFLTVYALGANPFSQTVAPFDLLLSYPGWSSLQADQRVLNTQPSDIVDSLLPVWVQLKQQIREGKGALWYPYGSGGVPISLELCNPAFLIFLLIKNNAVAFYFVGLFKLLVSGFGTYLLLKVFVRWLPAIWGGTVYMLCGFNTAWFFWDQVTTAMWIPWLLWVTLKYLKTDNIRWLPAITLASVLLIFGGFPAVAAFGLYSFGLLVLVWIIYELLVGDGLSVYKDLHRLGPAFLKAALPLLAVGIAFLISAVTLFPFMDNMSGINLGYRTNSGTSFDGVRDFLLFLKWETPLKVERTAYIGLPVMVLAAVGIMSAFRKNAQKMRGFIIFLAGLLMVSTLITFGLLPHRMIRAIPVFNSNHWSRLIVVPLLALAVLSSGGLDFLMAVLQTRCSRYFKLSGTAVQRVLFPLVILIIALQFHFQKDFFNTYNAVVPSSWFYPATPGIKYVQEHISPLQSVIADNSYMVAGTLGAYGIPEWYAHAFRTDKEKEVLGRLVLDPFASPTAAFIDGGNIQFDSPLMDQMVIKYLLVSRDAFERKTVVSISGSGVPAPALSLAGDPWRQHLNISEDMMIGAFGFIFGTDGRDHLSSDLRLTLVNDRGEKYAVEPQLNKDLVSDTQWSYFIFPSKVFLKKGEYSIVLSQVGNQGDGKLTVGTTFADTNGGNYLEINGKKDGRTLDLKIGVYENIDTSALARKWRVLELENNLLVLENKDVTNGAYYISGLEAADKIDFSVLDLKVLSSDSISMNYSGSRPGWIVLPMHLNSGWKAYTNGRQVNYDTYLDILPAIPVPGPCKVEFRYEPEAFWKGLAVSLTGVSLFLLFSGLLLKKGRPLALHGTGSDGKTSGYRIY